MDDVRLCTTCLDCDYRDGSRLDVCKACNPTGIHKKIVLTTGQSAKDIMTNKIFPMTSECITLLEKQNAKLREELENRKIKIAQLEGQIESLKCIINLFDHYQLRKQGDSKCGL